MMDTPNQVDGHSPERRKQLRSQFRLLQKQEAWRISCYALFMLCLILVCILVGVFIYREFYYGTLSGKIAIFLIPFIIFLIAGDLLLNSFQSARATYLKRKKYFLEEYYAGHEKARNRYFQIHRFGSAAFFSFLLAVLLIGTFYGLSYTKKNYMQACQLLEEKSYQEAASLLDHAILKIQPNPRNLRKLSLCLEDYYQKRDYKAAYEDISGGIQLYHLSSAEQKRLDYFLKRVRMAYTNDLDLHFSSRHPDRAETSEPLPPSAISPHHSHSFTDEEKYEPDQFENAEDFYDYWSEDFADYYDAENFYNEHTH